MHFSIWKLDKLVDIFIQRPKNVGLTKPEKEKYNKTQQNQRKERENEQSGFV